jgi:hypothetical protein
VIAENYVAVVAFLKNQKSIGCLALFVIKGAFMPNLADPVFRGKSGPVNRGWSELWAEYGGVLLHVDCTAADVVRSGAAAGVLYLQGGGGFGPADQAAFVRYGLAHGVSVMGVDLYLAALLGGAGDDQAVMHWRSACDRVFGSLVLGPVEGAMDSAPILAQARNYLSSNRTVFLLGKDWRSAPLEALKVEGAA